MAKKLDSQALSSALTGAVEGVFKQMCHVAYSAEPVAVEKDIIEYDGRMRLFPMEKFNGPAYVAVVNYALSQRHLEVRDVVGTFVFYVKEDMVERIFKAFGRSASESEDEAKCQSVVGELCQVISANLKDRLIAMDLIDLVVSSPETYKNSVPAGVLFDFNLFKKQEILFSFWKEKCIAVELCLGVVPVKGR